MKLKEKDRLDQIIYAWQKSKLPNPPGPDDNPHLIIWIEDRDPNWPATLQNAANQMGIQLATLLAWKKAEEAEILNNEISGKVES